MNGYGRGFGPGMGPGFDSWLGREWWVVGALLTLLLVAALVAVIVWLVMRDRRPRSDDPLRTAAARYAAGRISRDEFETIRRNLEAPAPAEEVSQGTDVPA